MEKKAFLGHKIKRLRTDMSMTQAQMAENIGISTSYLNLLERNQRPITVPLLLKLGESFDIDLQDFARDEEEQRVAGLREVCADPLFKGVHVSEAELREATTHAPNLAQAMLTLYRAHRSSREEVRVLAEAVTSGERLQSGAEASRARVFPAEEVRDFFQAHDNHFPELEAAAEELWRDGSLEIGQVWAGLSAHLQAGLGIRAKVLPMDVMVGATRRYDRHSRRILLSEMLAPHSRTFHIANQLAYLRHGPLLDGIVNGTAFMNEDARRLARAGLANYYAAAVIMPYDRFLKAARELRYDVEILSSRFGTSFEQSCHRLTTLQRPGAKGVPFFLIRVDKAGNVSKRFAPRAISFARFGGACPRWVVYDAFRAPGVIHTQFGEMPDGIGYFSLARTTTATAGGYRQPAQQYAIAIGCEVGQAHELVYADGFDFKRREAAVPIGVNCRLCERPDCAQRAFPPLNQRLVLDENVRGLSAYRFGAE